MALKSKLTKTEFDALPDALKEHYKQDGDNYLLESDEAAELRAAKDREKEEARKQKERADTLQREKDEIERQAREAEAEKARKNKDVEALEASWKADKEAAILAERKNTEKREQQLRVLLEENEAVKIAAEISTSPKLILPHIRERLRAELDGEKPITRVLDAEGKPSSKTLDDLRQEFVDNKEFASIIKGSNASGGGANGNGGSGSGATSKSFKDMSEPERVALHRDNPTRYRELARESGIVIP